MNANAKIIIALLCLGLSGLAAVPIDTELRVREAAQQLESLGSIADAMNTFGTPPRQASTQQKSAIAERTNLKISEFEDLLIFNQEGIPPWTIYVMNSDGETILDSAVERFW